LIKPTLDKITTFDARYERNITFAYNGQISKVEAFFYNNETDELIYGEGVVYITQKPNFVLTANALLNSATPYYVKIRIYDSSNNVGPWSDPVVFYCREQSGFYFVGLNDDAQNIIPSSYYEFELHYDYDPLKNEQLDHYSVFLYDKNQNLIEESQDYYDTSEPYAISNALNGDQYLMQAVAYTRNGMEIRTSLISLVVSYRSATAFSYLSIKNNYSEGNVKISAAPVIVEGEASWEPLTFIDGGGITVPVGENIVFPDGYLFPEDFWLSYVTQTDKAQAATIEMTSDTEKIRIGLIVRAFNEGGTSDGNKVFAYLYCESLLSTAPSYYITSNELNYVPENQIAVSMKREGGLMDITIQYVSLITTVSEEVE